MLLSVVIITWNAQRDVKQCIDSILDAVGQYTSEIIVTDNGSKDETLSILKTYKEKINLICLKKNKGVAFARNICMKAAKGEFIWILDVDTVVNKEAISGMIDYLKNNHNCGICACRLQSEDGEIQDSCRKFPYPKHKIRNLIISNFNSFLPRNIYNNIKKKNESQFYRKELHENQPFEIEYVIGACQLFRKSILDEVGYLDEKIFYGPEDADFCRRIKNKGYKIICLPAFCIIHHYNRISNRKFFTKMTLHHFKGLLRFYVKISKNKILLR